MPIAGLSSPKEANHAFCSTESHVCGAAHCSDYLLCLYCATGGGACAGASGSTRGGSCRRQVGSNVHIVFFPGGPQGGVFANNVYNGAKQAEADLGCKVDYVWSDWDPQKMIQQFREAVATKPDGIAVMGHPGDEAFDPFINEAEKKGIIVTSQNTELPKMEAKYAAERLRLRRAENSTARAMPWASRRSSASNLKKGDRAMVWGLLSQPTRGERTKGVIDALKEAGLTVDYIEIDAATNKDPRGRQPDLRRLRLLASRRQAGGHRSRRTDRHRGDLLKAAGKKPGDITIAGFDLSPATIDRHQGRLDRAGHRPAGMAAGLPAHPANLPDQGVRLLRPAHQHRGGLRGQEQHGVPRPRWPRRKSASP